MNCYIQIDCFSLNTLEFIKQHEDIQGVVLGDYTCNRRMFSGGYAGLIKSVDQYESIDKEIIIQTPLYATSRIFDEMIDGIIFLNTEYHVKKYLIQDIGVLATISQMIPDAELIWSPMGRNRGNIFNMDSVLFLQEQGLTGMEVGSKSRLGVLRSQGMKAYASYGNIVYKSVSRNCYNKLFSNDSVCRTACSDHKERMTTKNGKKISVDGFFLDKDYYYDDSHEYWNSVYDNCENVIIHAESIEKAIKLYNNYKEIIMTYE